MRAGLVTEITKTSGDWVFVDVGFSRDKKTGGLLVNDGTAVALTFSDLKHTLVELSSQMGRPMNLVLEAPLSSAFTGSGNPAGRSMERSGKEHRYWYAGLGCQVTVAAAYLLRGVLENNDRREVRLFEAFVSFKSRESTSSHTQDVTNMRAVAWKEENHNGHVISPDKLLGPDARTIESAFKVFGFNCGIPPVILAGA
jgi:hypothetical protein